MPQHNSDVKVGGMEAPSTMSTISAFSPASTVYVICSLVHIYSVHSIYIEHLLYVRHFAKNCGLKDGLRKTAAHKEVTSVRRLTNRFSEAEMVIVLMGELQYKLTKGAQ